MTINYLSTRGGISPVKFDVELFKKSACNPIEIDVKEATGGAHPEVSATVMVWQMVSLPQLSVTTRQTVYVPSIVYKYEGFIPEATPVVSPKSQL